MRRISIPMIFAGCMLVFQACSSLGGSGALHFDGAVGETGQGYFKLADNLWVTSIDGRKFSANPGSMVYLKPGPHTIAVSYSRSAGNITKSAEYVFKDMNFEPNAGIKLWYETSDYLISFKSSPLRMTKKVDGDNGVKLRCGANAKIFRDKSGRFILIDNGMASAFDPVTWKKTDKASLSGGEVSDAYYKKESDAIFLSFASGGAAEFDCALFSQKQAISGLPSVKCSAGYAEKRLGVTADGALYAFTGAYEGRLLGNIGGGYTDAFSGSKAVAFLSGRSVKILDHEGNILREITYEGIRDASFTNAAFDSSGKYLIICRYHEAPSVSPAIVSRLPPT